LYNDTSKKSLKKLSIIQKQTTKWTYIILPILLLYFFFFILFVKHLALYSRSSAMHRLMFIRTYVYPMLCLFHSSIIVRTVSLYSQTMTFFSLIIILFTAANAISGIRVGIIQNASLINVNANLTVNALACNECLCAMLASTGNLSIVSLNCYTINSTSVSCPLFTTASYFSSSLCRMENSSNSIFYFLELPSSNQSQTTATTTVTTTKSMNHVLIRFSKLTDLINCPKPDYGLEIWSFILSYRYCRVEGLKMQSVIFRWNYSS
jgi:hypothetical protein